MINSRHLPLLTGKGIGKVFRGGDGRELAVLDQLNIEITRHEVVAIVGSSGAGKSTLLQILGGLDRPTDGDVQFDGQPIAELNPQDLARFRNSHVGFVFQFHHLLKDFTALENVMIPGIIGGITKEAAKDQAKDLLMQVGLEGRLSHKPRELSGGEQQRVAVARALCNRPKLLLADEPSGNLDSQTSHELHQVLFEMRDVCGLAMVIVTHNNSLATMADRILELSDGKLHDTEKGFESVK
tara:strand:+ start:128 stop:847 length:720 start_codon:yes stop_codon:yes gene_type:complete